MAENNNSEFSVKLRNAPAKFRSPVWQYFGFRSVGVDKTKSTCKLCFTDVSYKSGNTSNMRQHLERHHRIRITIDNNNNSTSTSSSTNSSICENSETPKSMSFVAGQLKIGDAIKASCMFGLSHPRAKAITNAIGYFIAHDMRPYAVVEDCGFQHLLKIAEPRYKIPSRPYFSETVIPGFYTKVMKRVQSEIKAAESVAITTDSWTSRAVQSYVTVTAHYVDSNWNAKSVSLETKVVNESHTAEHLAQGLLDTVHRWNLKRNGIGPPITTDNAANIVKAVKDAELSSPHIGCFAHTVNLAVQKGLKVPQLDRLLGRIRRIVSFFHKSTTAVTILTATQAKLGLPQVKLIMDVSTRWNSTYDMVSRYLEQQPAVFSTLTSKELKKNDIITLSNDDVKSAEAIVELLEPFKTVTRVMSSTTQPTASLIHPMKEMLLAHLAIQNTDTTIIKDVKNSMDLNLRPRYSDPEMLSFLMVCSAIDPRFKSLPYIDASKRQEIYDLLQTMTIFIHDQQVKVKDEKDTPTPQVPQPSHNEPPLPGLQSQSEISDNPPGPPPKKICALEDLFGDVFVVHVEQGKTTCERVQLEVNNYVSEPNQSLKSSPLDWWKVNQNKYPLLAVYARHVLCIPATSVASERVFSTSGDIVTAQRAALSTDNVEMLVFLAKNIEPIDLN